MKGASPMNKCICLCGSHDLYMAYNFADKSKCFYYVGCCTCGRRGRPGLTKEEALNNWQQDNQNNTIEE